MDIGKQIDSQPLSRAFTFSKEKERALHGLRGILAGVVADKKLNEKELLFLDSWLQSQQYLSEDHDVLRILTQVGEIMALGQISPESLQQMQATLEHFISLGDETTGKGVGEIDELMGFLTGVASDGVLNDQEIAALSAWLDKHSAIRDTWPASVIIERLAFILEDGVVTEEERADLLKSLQHVTAVNPRSIRFDSSTEVWEDKVDQVSLPNSTFCLTGDFVSGDRNSVETMLKLRGASISTNVNKTVDFLIIGTLASRDWLYTSHGRKIEKALLLKREGSGISVITERTLLRFLR